MATSETDTRVKTFITVSYSIPDGPDNLMRQEVHRVKDEDTNDFVTVSDETVGVGEQHDWVDGLQDQIDSLETQKADVVDTLDDEIELLQEEIDEIENL